MNANIVTFHSCDKFMLLLLYRGCNSYQSHLKWLVLNKAILRDLIAGTCLIILIILDSNWFFSPYDLEFGWISSKNNRAPLLGYTKLYALLQSHHWIQTGDAVRKHSIMVKIGDFLSRVTFKFDGWPWKTVWQLFYATSSFVHHSVAIGKFRLKLWPKKHRAPLLCHIKLCASFHCHKWIQTGGTVWKKLNWVLTLPSNWSEMFHELISFS